MNDATLEYLAAHRNEAPEALAEALRADVRLVGNIDRKQLAAYLLTSGVRKKLLAFRQSDQPSALKPLQEALEELDFIITSGIDYVETTDPLIAPQVAALLGGLVAVGVISEAEAAGFVTLGGGYLLDRLTAEECAAALAGLTRGEEQAALRARVVAGVNLATILLDGAEAPSQAGKPLPTWDAVVAEFAGAT